MRNPNPIEEIHANLDMIRGLGLTEDPDVIEALNHEAGEDFSVDVDDDGEAAIFGNTFDINELDEYLGLHITTERGLGFYASYSSVLPADLMG